MTGLRGTEDTGEGLDAGVCAMWVTAVGSGGKSRPKKDGFEGTFKGEMNVKVFSCPAVAGGKTGRGRARPWMQTEVRASWARPVPAWSLECLEGCRVARRGRSVAGKVRGPLRNRSVLSWEQGCKAVFRKTVSELTKDPQVVLQSSRLHPLLRASPRT